MKIFRNRQAAGKLLAQRLKKLHADLVLGIPRGGIVVASEVAKTLKVPLDVLVTRKIGAPDQEELALGAVDPDGETVWEKKLLSDLRLKIYDLREEIQAQWKEVKRRENEYRGAKKPLDIEDKIIILTDDGIATGATIISAIRFLKRHKAKRATVVTPVASEEAVDKIIRELGEFGEVIALENPKYFQSVGQFYYEFEPVSDGEVKKILS